MKKILLASALALSATSAMAEVSLSGKADMGAVYTGNDTVFDSGITLTAKMAGETDTGLSFGAKFDVEDADAADDGLAGTVYMSGAFGTVEMGDTLGAPEKTFGNLPEIGYSDLGKDDVDYLTGDSVNGTAPALLYTYSLDAATGAVSLSDGANGAEELALAGHYAFGNYGVGAGWEKADIGGSKKTLTILAADAKVGAADVKGFYAIGGEDADKTDHLGLGVTYAMGDVNLQGLVRQDDDGVDTVTSYGLGASYDLGAGAMVKGGLIDDDSAGSDPKADLGVAFKF